MAVSLTGSASAAATSVTLPAHNVGDCIIIYAWRNSTTLGPTIPSAGGTVPTWTDIQSTPATNAGGFYVLVWTIATATNHTSGTFTNANGVAAVVLSGADQATPIMGRVDNSGTGASASWLYYQPVFLGESTTGTPAGSFAWPQMDFSGNSAVVTFLSGLTVTTFGTVPSGWTRVLTDTSAKICINQANTTNTAGAGQTGVTQTGNTSSQYSAISVEVLAAGALVNKLKGQLTTNATSGNIPPHSAGDLIVAYACAISSATIPTAPSAGGTVPTWTSVYTGGTNVGIRVAYAVATASNHTSGTWTSAAAVTFTVVSRGSTFTGLGSLFQGPVAGSFQGSSTSHTGPTISPVDKTGFGLLLASGSGSAPAFSAAGNGSSRVVSASNSVGTKFFPKDGSAMVYSGTTGIWASTQLEIIGNIAQNFFSCA